MKGKRAIATASVTLFLTSFVPGCSSFSQTDASNGAWHPWSWLKSASAKRTEKRGFASTIRPQPGNPAAHYQLGSYYLESGRYHEAAFEFQKAVAIKPDYLEAFNLLAVSYDRLRDFAKAEKAYRTALAIKPDTPYLYNNLGHSFMLQQRWEEALVNLKRAVELNGGRPNTRMYNNLGTALVMTGHDREGQEAFAQAGGEAETHYRMARLFQVKGMFEEAKKQYKAALTLNPTSETYLRGLKECEQKAEALGFARDVRQVLDQQPQADPGRKPQKITGTTVGSVGIEISNGNGIRSFAQTIGRFLKERGFAVVRLTNADTFEYDETKIYYRKGYREASQVLAKKMPRIPETEEVREFDQPQVQIRMVLGKDLAAHRTAFMEESR